MRSLLLLAAVSCVLSACVVERPVPREPDFAARSDRDHRDERRDEHREGRYDDRDHRGPDNMPPPPGRY